MVRFITHRRNNIGKNPAKLRAFTVETPVSLLSTSLYEGPSLLAPQDKLVTSINATLFRFLASTPPQHPPERQETSKPLCLDARRSYPRISIPKKEKPLRRDISRREQVYFLLETEISFFLLLNSNPPNILNKDTGWIYVNGGNNFRSLDRMPDLNLPHHYHFLIP